MGFFKGLTGFLSNVIDSLGNSEIREVKAKLLKYSISCRCGGIAVPVAGTPNRYICVKCESRFANAKHNINSESWAYEEAVEEIKNQY
ncbi:hypothetical protein [Acinetobacter haemolyticus]|uniref:hypothetical protein n=1 Tax=Acinetobacter haemolyticus TaxID=29430 RepID=UPI000E58AE67|nr:hypothetical protein [Acinetobacter haemolyticus]QDJ93881.1 hypothetical protein AhaeAN54_017900 [Acinetobacter haemolyticus]